VLRDTFLDDPHSTLVVVAATAFLVAVIAWWLALLAREPRSDIPNENRRRAKTWGDIALGIGNGLFAGAAVAIAVFTFQQGLRDQIDRATKRSAFKTQVVLSSNLTGFDPPVHRPGFQECHLDPRFAQRRRRGAC